MSKPTKRTTIPQIESRCTLALGVIAYFLLIPAIIVIGISLFCHEPEPLSSKELEKEFGPSNAARIKMEMEWAEKGKDWPVLDGIPRQKWVEEALNKPTP